MNEIAIDIQNLSKVYKLYEKTIDRLKETLSITGKSYHRDFYALNNVNMQIRKGETVGIIGKNGAGKSTLLKIITGVLAPTTGSVKINGRISSLLELGAGFNPEYNGLENIYLNGTIMGMTKEEVDERLQDILDFADIGDFIYQPVKTYSSGMYVRLAFSVAINVNPDILIVDEALSVGDARFTMKCLKRIEEMKKKGITIIMVSHGIETVKKFADKAVLIEQGDIYKIGDPTDVCLEYYRLLFEDDKDKSRRDDKDISYPTKEDEADDVYANIPINEKDTYGQGGCVIDSIVIHGLDHGNVCKGRKKICVEIDYSFQIEKVKDIISKYNILDNYLFGLRVESKNKGVITDFATAIERDFDSITSDYSKVKLNFEFYFPDLMEDDYFFSPEIAIGEQNNLIPLKEYVFLFSIHYIPSDGVTGLMKFEHKIIQKEIA